MKKYLYYLPYFFYSYFFTWIGFIVFEIKKINGHYSIAPDEIEKFITKIGVQELENVSETDLILLLIDTSWQKIFLAPLVFLWMGWMLVPMFITWILKLRSSDFKKSFWLLAFLKEISNKEINFKLVYDKTFWFIGALLFMIGYFYNL